MHGAGLSLHGQLLCGPRLPQAILAPHPHPSLWPRGSQGLSGPSSPPISMALGYPRPIWPHSQPHAWGGARAACPAPPGAVSRWSPAHWHRALVAMAARIAKELEEARRWGGARDLRPLEGNVLRTTPRIMRAPSASS
ncbi:ubiquitin/ISG15-conjugating enzyme E2 L6 isoform X4 [Chroicocephalus ridibundus]|uniref:ubiquitin/ISG15-conjugating enzyme E2 L6 isoform X4 n=1 Tax=Chroicocephalus ridibundus TaxID=1192867 RepID=UPI002FDE27D2